MKISYKKIKAVCKNPRISEIEQARIWLVVFSGWLKREDAKKSDFERQYSYCKMFHDDEGYLVCTECVNYDECLFGQWNPEYCANFKFVHEELLPF